MNSPKQEPISSTVDGRVSADKSKKHNMLSL